MGNNPILCIIETFDDARSESAGYFDCAEMQVKSRMVKALRIVKINQNCLNPKPVPFLDSSQYGIRYRYDIF